MTEARTRYRVRTLLKAGAHLLAVSASDKAAIKRAWQRRENRLDEGRAFTRANRHGFSALGVVPRSLGCCVVDVDEGGDEAKDWLLEQFPNALAHPSSRKGRWHVWIWADAAEVGNYSWKSGYGAGQFRHGHGYVVLWDPGAVANWLLTRTDRDSADALTAFAADHKTSLAPSSSSTGAPLDLDQIESADWSEGNRNNTLNALAFIAAAHGEGVELLREHALSVGLTPAEVDKTLASADSAGTAVHADLLADLPKLPPAEGDVVRTDPKTGKRRVVRPAVPVVRAKNPAGLRKALEWLGIEVRYNTRADEREIRRGNGAWMPTSDRLIAAVRWELEEKIRVAGSKGLIPLYFGISAFDDVLNVLLNDKELDPFIDWLEALPEWDGTERTPTMLHEMFGAPDNPLGQWVSKFITLGAVWRAYRPGCKLDEMPVLIGRQGRGKSTVLERIVPDNHPEWYAANFNLAAAQKARVEALQKRVIVEVSDMAGADRAELKSLNGFLTTTDDGSVRLAYRRDTEQRPRRSILVGTADDERCLPNDPAGLRRFVPVMFEHGCQVEDWLAERREQLWAEALHRYRAGESARLPRSLIPAQRVATARHRRKAEALESAIQGLDPGPKSLAEIAFDVQMIDDPAGAAKMSMREQWRLVNALRTCGWVSVHTRQGNRWKRDSSPDGLL